MTPRIENEARIDVLAIMGAATRPDGVNSNYNMLAARSVVAEMIRLLSDIRGCGDWYFSALEIDTYAGHSHNGENLKLRLDALLQQIGEQP